jgi:site-specific DNA recombinase
MAKTIAYLRCSTQEQADSRLGLEAQQARTLAYAAAMGWDSPEVVQDAGYSAKSLQRPGMALIMERIRNGAIERVVVSKLDRLTRSVRDLCHIVELCNEHRVALVSATESLDTATAAGRMVVHLLGVVSQWEREAISERTREALAAKKRRGERLGRKPALNSARLEAAKTMLGAGFGVGHVARVLKVGRSTLYRVLAAQEAA